MAGKTYYEMLGVLSGASAQDIRKAFLKLSLKAHPDKAGNSPEAHDAFVALKEAYETLSDTDKRQKYDLDLEEEEENPQKRASDAKSGSKHAKSGAKHAKSGPSHSQHRSSRDEHRSSQPPNRGSDGYKSGGYRGEASSSRFNAPPPHGPAPWEKSSEFRRNHPTCPRAEYPRHCETFAEGGRDFCLCHHCERRILEDVYTRKAEVVGVIGDVNFVNRHIHEIWRAVPGLFTPDMRQRLIILEQTAQAQLVFLDAWAGRTIAWLGCPSCTRRVLNHKVMVDIEKLCRQIEYWVRHAPTLARLTREVIMGPPIRDPWAWTREFTSALDKCRKNDF